MTTASADATTPEVGIVSGTGAAGRALAARLVDVGYHVVLGSRDLDRATEAVAVVHRRLESRSTTGTVRAGENHAAASTALVFLATNASHTVTAATAHAAALADTAVVSMASRMAVGVRGMRPSPPPEGAVAVALAAALPESRVVAALHHVPAALLGDVRLPLVADLLVCGDDAGAVEAVMACLSRITGGRVFDAGGLANAVALEAMTAVLLTLNRSSGGRYGIELVDQRRARSDAG